MAKESIFAKKSVKYGAIGFLLGGPFGAAMGAIFGQRADVHGDLLERLNAIRTDIKNELADDDKTIKSKLLITEWLKVKSQQGNSISQDVVDSIFAFASDYVQRTPNLMEVLFKTAKWSNLENEVIILLQSALSYFEDVSDLIPDSYGIAGLLDDAYVTQHLIERVITWQGGILAHSVEKDIDLSAANSFVAALLPANIVTALNAKVEQVVGASEARQILNQMLEQSKSLQGGWSQASDGIDWKKEIVKDQIYSDLAKDGIYMR